MLLIETVYAKSEWLEGRMMDLVYAALAFAKIKTSYVDQ